MEAAGRTRPTEYPTAAHHIVAGGSPKAEEARSILKKFNIGINDEANGVFLPTNRTQGTGAYHRTLHTYEYYEKVNRILETANTREDVIYLLRDIAEQLANSTF